MFIQKFFIEACREYDPFYCMPRLCDEMPTEGDCIQVNFINADASELFALGDGKYRIKGTEITFKDPRNVMSGMSDGFVHLVLTTYYDRVKMDYEDFIPETEAIHAGVVDRDHESVFKAFAYTCNGKPRIDVRKEPNNRLKWGSHKKSKEMNAPYIIGIGSHSLMCHSIKLDHGLITLNDKIIEDLWQDLGDYNKLSLSSIVQVDLATGLADFFDDQEGPSYAELLMQDVTIINETSGQCYYALHE